MERASNWETSPVATTVVVSTAPSNPPSPAHPCDLVPQQPRPSPDPSPSPQAGTQPALLPHEKKRKDSPISPQPPPPPPAPVLKVVIGIFNWLLAQMSG